jgi:hypothetical protein
VVRLAMVLVAAAFLLAVVWVVATAVSRAARLRLKRPAREPRTPVGYEWERRRDQLYRRMKSVPGPEEHRDEILRFIESRQGVEAYVEPRTMIHPLSVVLVAEDGEWVRYQLRDDAFIRESARARKVPIHDAAKVGYPERMRRYRRGLGPETRGPSDGGVEET